MKSRVQLAIGIAVACALIVIAVVIWVDRMQPVAITMSTPIGESIYVSVTGAVNSPGVVEVPLGARLQAVVDAAGGFATDADTDSLNLAGRVGDGEEIEIPTVGQSGVMSQVAEPSGGLVDINTASAAELAALPGIGEVLAGRIVDYRETDGPFTSIDQLSAIDGISPRLVDDLRPLVTVSPDG